MMDRIEYFKKLSEIVASLKEAQKIAVGSKEIGIKNISQPGIVKEVIMALQLKHRLHAKKNEHDAEDFDNLDIKYEYLSCLEGKSFQFDRVNSLNLRYKVLDRNTKVYCGVFEKSNPLQLIRIYEVDPKSLFKLCVLKLKNSKSTSKHIGISEKEILAMKGKYKLIFPKKASK